MQLRGLLGAIVGSDEAEKVYSKNGAGKVEFTNEQGVRDFEAERGTVEQSRP